MDDVEPGREAEQGANRAFRAAEYAPEPGPGRDSSPEERDGVPDTDTQARTPLKVGESINMRGEEVGRAHEQIEGYDEATGRPYATDTGDEPEGVDSQPAVTPGSPDLGTGDQSG